MIFQADNSAVQILRIHEEWTRERDNTAAVSNGERDHP
jgi:hypothetical protein